MRYQNLFRTMALLATVAACADAPTGPSATAPGPEAQPRPAMNASSSRVVGYLANWFDPAKDSIQYNKLTHVIYAFVDVQPNGTLSNMRGDTKLQGVVQRAHAVGAKVLISVGGGGGFGDNNYEPMADSVATRKVFIDSLVVFVNNYGLDGVDIDWEVPNTTAETGYFSALMAELDTAMHSRGKMLTAAVTANDWFGKWISSSVFANVDFLTLMAYDGTAASSTYPAADSSLAYWASRGLPQSKTVLGVQFYGTNGSGTEKSYREIVRNDSLAPYGNLSNGWTYNGIALIKQKTVLSQQRASGIGIWHVAQDTVRAGISLVDAIHDVMNTTKVLYDDARITGWDNWSWSTTVNFANTAPTYFGGKSIAATYTAAWAGLYLHHSTGVSATGLTKLEFYVHGGSAGGQNLMVQVGNTGGWGTMVPVNSYVPNNTITAGAWKKVSIPMSALGLSALAITDFAITDNTGGAQPTFYVDQIQFVP